MALSRRVLLSGKSLLFSGLQATLETTPGVDFQIVDPLPECIREAILEWQPEVLILESTLLQTDFSLSLMKDFPQLKLFGVDLEEDHLLVFSSQFSGKPTTKDLLHLLENCIVPISGFRKNN